VSAEIAVPEPLRRKLAELKAQDGFESSAWKQLTCWTRKRGKYEVLAASHMERAPLSATHDHVAAASAFTAVAIVLREVADALDEAAWCVSG
jgi:hypothetical protein